MRMPDITNKWKESSLETNEHTMRWAWGGLNHWMACTMGENVSVGLA